MSTGSLQVGVKSWSAGLRYGTDSRRVVETSWYV